MEAAKTLVNNMLRETERHEKSEAMSMEEKAGQTTAMHIHTEQVLGLIPPGQKV